MYDFRSNDNVQYECFSDIYKLLNDIQEARKSLRRDEFVAVYSSLGEILVLLQELDINRYAELINGYDGKLDYISDGKYILTVSWDGNMIVEPSYNDERLVMSEAMVTYLNEDIYTLSELGSLIDNDESVLAYHIDNQSNWEEKE